MHAHRVKAQIVLLFSLMALLLTGSGTKQALSAENAKGCHCFKNRVYDPANKKASDSYLLATGFNSLLSKYYGISKRQIVMLKMQGSVSQDDLLIGLTVSKLSGTPLNQLLNLRKKNNSWVASFGPDGMKSSGFSTALNNLYSGANEKDTAYEIANVLISDYFNTPHQIISALRIQGFSEKEVTLIMLLSKKADTFPEYIVSQYTQQNKSWSEIAHLLGLSPEDAGKFILNSKSSD